MLVTSTIQYKEMGGKSHTVRSIIETAHNITINTVLILYDEIRDGGAIRDKGGRDALAVEPILPGCIRPGGVLGGGKWEQKCCCPHKGTGMHLGRRVA